MCAKAMSRRKPRRSLYGVVIDAVSFIVDVRATEKKPAEMAKGAS